MFRRCEIDPCGANIVRNLANRCNHQDRLTLHETQLIRCPDTFLPASPRIEMELALHSRWSNTIAGLVRGASAAMLTAHYGNLA